MALAKNSNQRETDKFEEVGGKTTVRVKVESFDGASTEAKQDDIIAKLDKLTGFEIPPYDYVVMVLSAGDTTETYTFKTGGAGGTTVATIVVVYTDSTREVFSSATKT